MCGFSSGIFTITPGQGDQTVMHWLVEDETGSSSSISLYQVTLSEGKYSSDGNVHYFYSASSKTASSADVGPPMAGEIAMSTDGEALYAPSLCDSTETPDFNAPYNRTERGADTYQQDFATSAWVSRDHHREIFEAKRAAELAKLSSPRNWRSRAEMRQKRLELVNAYLADLKKDLLVLIDHYQLIGVDDEQLKNELHQLKQADLPFFRGEENTAVVAMYTSLL